MDLWRDWENLLFDHRSEDGERVGGEGVNRTRRQDFAFPVGGGSKPPCRVRPRGPARIIPPGCPERAAGVVLRGMRGIRGVFSFVFLRKSALRVKTAGSIPRDPASPATASP